MAAPIPNANPIPIAPVSLLFACAGLVSLCAPRGAPIGARRAPIGPTTILASSSRAAPSGAQIQLCADFFAPPGPLARVWAAAFVSGASQL